MCAGAKAPREENLASVVCVFSSEWTLVVRGCSRNILTLVKILLAGQRSTE